MTDRRLTPLLLWAGLLASVLPFSLAGCGSTRPASDWLAVSRDGAALILDIGGQCGPSSYLHNLRLAPVGASGLAGSVIWEIVAVSPTDKTAAVTVGTPPPGFAEITHDLLATPLEGVVAVTMRTNFWYTARIDLSALADGHEVRLTPRPVLNENASVSPPRC